MNKLIICSFLLVSKVFCTIPDVENFQEEDKSEATGRPGASVAHGYSDTLTSSTVREFQDDDKILKNRDKKIDIELSSLPQAAALQGFPLPAPSIGGRNYPLNRGGSSYHGFNYPRNPTCGLCSRERNLCQIISGIFTRSPLPYGYSLVTAIPAGVCNVSIVEIKPTKNFFALRRPDSTYILNGNWKIQAAGTFAIAGTLFDYSPADGKRGEMLEAPGPLLEPVDLMIIYQSPNPGIKYEYRVPLPDIIGSQQPSGRVIPPSSPGGAVNVPSGREIQSPRKHLQTLLTPGSRPNHRLPSATGGIPFSNQGGSPARHPLLVSKQGSSPGTHFNTQSRSHGGSVFTQRPKSTYDGLPGINNWPSYSQPHGSVSSPSSKGVVPLEIPPQVQQTGQKFNIFPNTVGNNPKNGLIPTPNNRNSQTFLKNRFPGVLNTDPREIPLNPAQDIQSGHQSSFKDYNIIKIPLSKDTDRSFRTPNDRDPSVNHRARHKHGSRDIVPGPAVGGQGQSLSVGENSDKQKRPLESGRTEGRKRKRLKKKKGRRKKGKKRRIRFVWTFKGLSDCSKKCGGGNQTSVLSCVRRKKGKVVTDRLCNGVSKPEILTVACNLKPCPATWVPRQWGPCSATCGIGVQTRGVSCKQEVSQTLTLMVPEGACLTPKDDIETSQICNLGDCPSKVPHWDTGQWTTCSSTCGNGTRTRSISCIVNGSPAADSTCQTKEPRPNDQESCDMGSCVTDLWFFSRWSEKCSEMCGEGTQTRSVFCLSSEDGRADECPPPKPIDSRSCADDSGCGGMWFAGPWSDCSVPCGKGWETRRVQCLNLFKGQWKTTSTSDCKEVDRPPESQECLNDHCQPTWFTSEWEACSAECDGGVKEREVKCYDSKLHPSAGCSVGLKPHLRATCNPQSCFSTSTTSTTTSFTTITTSTHSPQSKSVNVENENDESESGKKENDENNENEGGEIEKKDGESGSGNEDGGDNTQTNELEIIEKSDRDQNFLSDKATQEKEQHKKKGNKEKKNKKKEQKEPNCIDRIKNCHLVFRARLCRLMYYNKLCCSTCKVPRT